MKYLLIVFTTILLFSFFPQASAAKTGLGLVSTNPVKQGENVDINYTLPASSKNLSVKLEIFNFLGQKIKTIVNTYQSSGTYYTKFPTDQITPAVYVIRLTVQYNNGVEIQETIKVVITKKKE